jgi:hypothetical protein
MTSSNVGRFFLINYEKYRIQIKKSVDVEKCSYKKEMLKSTKYQKSDMSASHFG